MSTETQAPLNPEVETETAPEAAAIEEVLQVEEVPQPDYSKLLQKEQMARANMEKKFEKKFDELLDAIKSGGSKQQQANKLDRLKTYMESEEGKSVAVNNPGLLAVVEGVAEEAAEASRRANETDERQARIDAFETWVAEFPPGFRAAYTREQRRLLEH